MQAFGCWILQLLPKFGFCIRYTRPRRLESVHLFTYCIYLFVHVFIFHYMYIFICIYIYKYVYMIMTIMFV